MTKRKLLRPAMLVTLLSLAGTGMAQQGKPDNGTDSKPAHSAHDHARMMAEMGEMPAAAPAVLPGESVYQLDVQLTDQDGGTFRFADSGGRPRLVSMFYASCRIVCPLIIDQLKRIETSLDTDQRKLPGVLMLSIDPERDTPQTLRALADSRKVDAGSISDSNWTIARSDAGSVRPLSAVLGVQYRQLPDGEFNHSSVITLLDAQGRILAQTNQLGAKPDPEFLRAVRAALNADAR